MEVHLKVMLQDRESLKYFQDAGKWTGDPAQAADFVNFRKASEFASQSKLPNVDMIMTFGDPMLDVRIPASASVSLATTPAEAGVKSL